MATAVGANAKTDEQPILQTQRIEPEFKLKKVRFAVDAGFSYRTAKLANEDMLTSEAKSFLEKMRYGAYYGASITPFFGKTVGLGAKFTGNRYYSKYPGLSYEANTFYVAPELMFRVPTKSRRNMWIFALSIGYVAYRDTIEASSGGITLVEKTKAHGYKDSIDVGFDIRLTGNVFLGLKLSATSGVANIIDDGTSYKESLHAIEFGAGLRF